VTPSQEACQLLRPILPVGVEIEPVTWGREEWRVLVRIVKRLPFTPPSALFLTGQEVVDHFDILGDDAAQAHYLGVLRRHHMA